MDTEVNHWRRRGLLHLTSYGGPHYMEEVTRYESTFRSTEKDIVHAIVSVNTKGVSFTPTHPTPEIPPGIWW